MDESLELLSAAFAEFMTPEEDGTPILLCEDLKHALQVVGIPPGLSKKLQPHMDPQSIGKITFEDFVSVCQSQLENDEGMFDDEEDVDFTPQSDEAGQFVNSKQQHVYELLSNKKGTITPQSLSKVVSKLNLAVSESDLKTLASMAPNREAFEQLWEQLDSH